MTQAVGSLIAVAPQRARLAQQPQIIAMVEAQIGRLPERAHVALAQLVGTHDEQVRTWQDSGQLPKRERLVCFGICGGQHDTEENREA